ncbi:unnamed protein product [Rotaria sordida]|uniref:Uncharacterized protein n=1 Tax=Rotaria sordida TaxID=392033 RepID=A0A820FHY8_9BILA|nr:unnamed protein product [Rotaria sordida]
MLQIIAELFSARTLHRDDDDDDDDDDDEKFADIWFVNKERIKMCGVMENANFVFLHVNSFKIILAGLKYEK